MGGGRMRGVAVGWGLGGPVTSGFLSRWSKRRLLRFVVMSVVGCIC